MILAMCGKRGLKQNPKIYMHRMYNGFKVRAGNIAFGFKFEVVKLTTVIQIEK